MKKSLLFLLTLFTIGIGYSQTFTEDFITYSVTSTAPNTVAVTGYDDTNGGAMLDISDMVTDYSDSLNPTYTVTSIGSGALQGSQITSATIPNSVTSIGSQAFRNSQLTSFTNSNNLVSIGDNAFDGCSLTSINIPNSVTYIGSQSFLSNNLTSVTIPSGVANIGAGAFYSNNLTNVTISEGVINISIGAFQNNNLAHITIPSSITNIDGAAFRNNPLTTVTSQGTTPATIYPVGINDSFYYRPDIDLTIPSGTASAYVAAEWTGFNSVTQEAALAVGNTFIVDYITYEVTSVTPDTVKAIDYDFAGGVNVDIPATLPYNISTYDVTNIGNAAFLGNVVNGEQISSVNIPNSVLSIDENAFNGNNLTDVTIPDSVINIGGQAFAHNDLINVIIGNNVEDIAINAFRNNQLTSITIPASVTSIGHVAFGINPLSTIISLATTPSTITTGLGDSFTINSDRSNINLILTGNTTDEYVTDNGALWTGFKMVFEATSATTVKVTDYEAANGTNVSIPATITVPSVTVFNVIEIEDSAFANKGLTSVSIPDSVTSIGISAFESNNLTDVTIPDNVTVIGTTAFSFNALTNVVIGTNVTIIGIGAFVNNSLIDITIPSNVTNIGLLAFGNNPSLASVTSLATIPPSITTGNNDTFIFDRSNTALHIPAGTMGAYVTDPGALWTGFNPVTEDALGISDFELANDIKVFNTIDELNIISSGTVLLENYTIYSITGAKVKNGTESSISINDISKGIYIIELTFDTGRLVKKFAK